MTFEDSHIVVVVFFFLIFAVKTTDTLSEPVDPSPRPATVVSLGKLAPSPTWMPRRKSLTVSLSRRSPMAKVGFWESQL